MKLKTSTGEVDFNRRLISHVHLSPDHSLLTVHFINGTHFGLAAETDEERVFAGEFLAKLADESSGFISVGNEVLNLKSAMWIAIPIDGPIQVRWADNLTRSFDAEDRDSIRKISAE
jgi:hypothetical protein